MDKSKKFLENFARRYELTLLNCGLKYYNDFRELRADIKKVICYPLYTHTDFFNNYCNKISICLISELQNSISIFKPSKIKQHDIFSIYSDSLYDNYRKIVDNYFIDMLSTEGVNVAIANDLRNNVILEIQNAKFSTKRSIEMILDAHNQNCSIRFKEKFINFLLRTIEQFPSLLKPNI